MLVETCTITAEKMELCSLKNERLFTCLYEKYFQKVYDCALFYCGQKEMAEDVTQIVFLNVWQNLNWLRPKFSTWNGWHNYLFISARNTAYNLIRKKNRMKSNYDKYSLLLTEPVFYDVVIEKEYFRILTGAIGKLSYQQREIFMLTYYRFKPKVIAENLDLTSRTVSNTLTTARRRLQEYVKEHVN